jgi:hypothetical protein
VIRRLIFLAISVLLFFAVVGFLAYRPATVTGVHAGELASSVGGAAGGGSSEECRDLGNGDWRCHSSRARKGAKPLTYRVHVHGQFGCWKARRTGRAGPRTLSGCLTIVDYF